MSKIKKKPGWSRYSKPYLSSAPTEPLKTLREEEETVLVSKTVYDGTSFPLDELVPEGQDISELRVTFKWEHSGYDGDRDNTIVVSTVSVKEKENPHYKRQLKAYEKAYSEWKVKKDAFTEELKEWKAWVKQEEEADTQHKLAWAEKLLKKHGRL